MRKVTNKEISQVFKEAKKQVQTNLFNKNKFSYICLAIDSLQKYENTQLVLKCQIAKSIISERLGGCTSLNWWLRAKHGVDLNPTAECVNKLQQTRHAWLDSLIKEFDKPGYYKE